MIAGILKSGAPAFNGVHMRMEKDAADWAIIMGGRQRLWQLYKEAMTRAGLDPGTPLYIASGLLKAAAEDKWSRDEMRSLTGDIVASKARPLAVSSLCAHFVDFFPRPGPACAATARPRPPLLNDKRNRNAKPTAHPHWTKLTREPRENGRRMQLASNIVYKEMFLTEGDLADVRNEQSGLVDFLVMRKAAKLVGIGVSTFSFYLTELRLMDGLPPADTELLMASYIGTDELFFSCGIAAVGTRMALEAEGRLPNLCRRPSGRQCFIDRPPGGPVKHR